MEQHHQPAQQTQQHPVDDPGKGLGIAGFVLAFVGVQLVGLILSIVGYKKSKAVGIKNSLALAGIILNSIFLALAVILIPIYVAITIVAYNGVSSRADTSAAQAAASSVVKWSELYYADNETYPLTYTQAVGERTSYPLLSQAVMKSEPSPASTVEFYECDGQGNKVGYWDFTTDKVVYTYTGASTGADNCTLVTQ